jgi:hypothetical protein
MIDTPRCGQPVKYYELRRPPDAMDAVARQPPCPDSEGAPTSPCFRPKGHPGERHESEWSYRRSLAQAARRKARWWRQRRARMTDPGDRLSP